MHWIKAEMHEYILKNWRLVKVATTKAQRKLFFNLRSHKTGLDAMSPRRSKPGQAAGRQARRSDRDGNPPVGPRHRAGSADRRRGRQVLADRLPVVGPAGADQGAGSQRVRRHVRLQSEGLETALGKLDPRSRRIVEARWLANDDGSGATLHTLAEEFGVSAERIRQIETAALKKMKTALAAPKRRSPPAPAAPSPPSAKRRRIGARHPQQGRQRDRRRRRGRRHAGRDRSVQLRHRRRRLHGHLPGQGQARDHDRPPRDGAELVQPGRVPGERQEIDFETAVASGASVGVPGTVRGWHEALQRYGTMSFKQVLAPAIEVATKGFPVSETFHKLTAENERKFQQFSSTSQLYLRNGKAVPAGSTLKNPDMAKAYREIAARGYKASMRADGRAMVDAVNRPPLAAGAPRRVPAP
jgi:RNA polymerase sigma factor (sigma-70 family)